MTNTLAYYNTATIMAIKNLIVNAPVDFTIKLSAAVIDESNKLECLSMANLSSLLQCLWERLEPTQVGHLSGTLLL